MEYRLSVYPRPKTMELNPFPSGDTKPGSAARDRARQGLGAEAIPQGTGLLSLAAPPPVPPREAQLSRAPLAITRVGGGGLRPPEP